MKSDTLIIGSHVTFNKNEQFLRGFTVEEVNKLTGIVGNRAKHVVEENDRVMKAIEAMSIVENNRFIYAVCKSYKYNHFVAFFKVFLKIESV